MTWAFTQTQDLKTIFDLHRQVFDEALDPSDFADRSEGFVVYCYLVARPGESPVGFAVFRSRGQEAVELWYAGVVPERRKQGAGSFLLDQSEQHMSRKGYSRLTISTFHRWNIMLSILMKRGYRIRHTEYCERREDFRIDLVHELRLRKELRYALTEVCNFGCLFCHNEGLGREKREQRRREHLLKVLQQAVHLGHTDITFTGGEPLLKKDRLFYLICNLGAMANPPDLTLVTNGSRMDDRVIGTLLDYPGKKKVHLSLHASDASTFQQVTRVRDPKVFDRVVGNIRRAAEAGLTVKMNHVVLQSFNHHRVLETIELARSLGASALKFVELLVLPGNPQDFRMYYDVRAIRGQILEVAQGPERLGPRQEVYTHSKDSRFHIEVQRCTCALGCSHCREVRDRTFSSDMAYHPCFVRAKKHYTVDKPAKLARILRHGERLIDGYAARYKDSSPTLTQQEKFVPNRRDIFFKLDDADNFRRHLARNGFAQTSLQAFDCEYYRPVSAQESWARFHKVLKLGWDYHDRSKVDLIYTDHEYLNTPEGMELRTTYLDSRGPMSFESLEQARHFLDRLDFHCFLKIQWQLETWTCKHLELNIAPLAGKNTVKISGPFEAARPLLALFACYDGLIEPLREPLEEFVQGEQDLA